MKQPEPESNPAVSAALISVGGSPTPILYVLRRHRPRHVWYFCSARSRDIADQIQSQLDWHPVPRFIEVERFEELGPCYKALRQKIPDLLDESKVKPAEVLVDYTGGTKTMSAALVLAATEHFQQFSYVGGDQREKGGLGVTIDGNERVLYADNPWTELAVREVKRACDLWSDCQFEVAARVLEDAATRVPRRKRFEAMAILARAMAARHRLHFKEARDLLGKVQKQLPPLFDGQDDRGLQEWVKQVLGTCSECSGDSASSTLLRELLDNVLRTAAQGRFEDAAARLYRAIEMQGQIRLSELTNNVFKDGRCRRLEKVPEAMKPLAFCKPDEAGEIKLTLEQNFIALAALGCEEAKALVDDIQSVDATGKTKSRFRAATEKRNMSILAHGVQPIDEKGFEQMKGIAREFLAFDLERESNPILSLDPQWF